MHLWVISGMADTLKELCEPITAMIERSMSRLGAELFNLAVR